MLDRLADRVASIFAHTRRFFAVERGRTAEHGTIRIHRYNDHIVVWDITDAGRRGKKVRRLSISPAYGAKNPTPEQMLERWGKALDHEDNYDAVHRLFKDVLHDYPNDFTLHESEERAIDVMPPGFAPLDVKGDHVSIRVEYKDFSVKNTDDTANESTCIPAMSGGIKMIPVFYRWVKDNEANIKHMTFLDVIKEMDSMGVKYHEYCAMD